MTKEIKIQAGQTAQIWFGVNIKGKLYYQIRTRDGSNSLRMWWIVYGFGNVVQLGTKTNGGSLDIPISWGKGIVSARLRGSAGSDTLVYLQENAEVDKTETFHF
jgi:hypothetical protein